TWVPWTERTNGVRRPASVLRQSLRLADEREELPAIPARIGAEALLRELGDGVEARRSRVPAVPQEHAERRDGGRELEVARRLRVRGARVRHGHLHQTAARGVGRLVAHLHRAELAARRGRGE